MAVTLELEADIKGRTCERCKDEPSTHMAYHGDGTKQMVCTYCADELENGCKGPGPCLCGCMDKKFVS